jgi:hypothetical protein
VPRSFDPSQDGSAVARPLRPGDVKRIGPSMSTEPGWMAALRTSSLLLGEDGGTRPQRSSMLLSFERPASAGHHEVTIEVTDKRGDQPTFTPLRGP